MPPWSDLRAASTVGKERLIPDQDSAPSPGGAWPRSPRGTVAADDEIPGTSQLK